MAGTKAIKLSGKRANGAYALVDEDDYERIKAMGSWYLSDTGYAVRRNVVDGRKQTIRMHRIVNNAPGGMVTDHLNNNRLDNRKANLRVTTQAENAKNRGYTKGYAWDRSKKLWMVRHRNKFYGRYKTEDEARLAYKLARSGAQKENKTHPRRRFLPQGVYFMSPMAQKKYKPYYIRPCVNGKRYFRGFFGSIAEAEKAYLEFKSAEGGLTS